MTMAPDKAGEGGLSYFRRRDGNLLSTLLSRELIEIKSAGIKISNHEGYQGYRWYNRKLFRRLASCSKPRTLFRTRLSGSFGAVDLNPVYDVQYSPRAYQDYRVIAVADELGYLSLVRAGYELNCHGNGGNKKGRSKGGGGEGRGYGGIEQVYNCGAQIVSPAIGAHGDDSFDAGEGLGQGEESPSVQPVLYTLAWNREGKRILTGYGDGSIRIWDLEKSSKPTCSSTIYAFEKSLKRVAWCQEMMISCSRTNQIYVHDQRMRIPLTNRIDCNQLGCKLTDISVLGDHAILASSSNQSSVHLFDLRYTYKLYKKIKPVESFDLLSPGYTTLKYDAICDNGLVYALGSDSLIRSVNFRTGEVGINYKVPGGVDFFTKIDVDSSSGILVSGGSSDSAWGFDLLREGLKLGGNKLPSLPFFELKEGKKVGGAWGPEYHGDDGEESDKENQPDMGEGELGVDDGGESTLCGRTSSAVALATRRGFQDSYYQIACGGDNSTVLVYD